MEHEKLLNHLEKIAFTRQQAKLYLAGVELGASLMQPLAKRAGIKRTTAIYCMTELLRRGFFTTVHLGKRTGYKASSATELLKTTKERESLIKTILPSLNILAKTKTSQ